jgi:hypothetical protein
MEAWATLRHSNTPFLHREAVADASFTACARAEGERKQASRPGAAYCEAEPRGAGAVRQPHAEQQDVGKERQLLQHEERG